MSIVVISERRVRPGSLDAVRELVSGWTSHDRTAASTHWAGRLLQQIDNPDQFLYVGEWSSCDVFRRRINGQNPPLPDDIFIRGSVNYYRRLLLRERAGLEPALVACSRIVVPSDRIDEVIDFIRAEIRERAPQRAGLVGAGLFQDIDDRSGIVVLHEWLTRDALEAFERDNVTRFGEALAPLDGRVYRFVGLSQISVGR
jgi:quinol monooxygenase YgiN